MVNVEFFSIDSMPQTLSPCGDEGRYVTGLGVDPVLIASVPVGKAVSASFR